MDDKQNGKRPYRGETLNGIMAPVVSEYEALRHEIDVYHDHQKVLMNFAILLVVSMLGLFGAVASTAPTALNRVQSFLFLLFPAVFTLLSLLYTDRTIRIIRIADYLHNYLRPQASLFAGESLFRWELYKQRTRIFNRSLALMLDRLRWTMFIFPSLLAIVLFLLEKSGEWAPIEIVLTCVDAIGLFVSFVVMFVVQESSGVADLRHPDLDSQ